MAEAAQPAPGAPRAGAPRLVSPRRAAPRRRDGRGKRRRWCNRNLRGKRRKVLFARLADQLGRLGNRITFGRQLRGWLVGDFLDLAAPNEGPGGAQLGDALARGAAALTQHVLGNDAFFADADLRLGAEPEVFLRPVDLLVGERGLDRDLRPALLLEIAGKVLALDPELLCGLRKGLLRHRDSLSSAIAPRRIGCAPFATPRRARSAGRAFGK